MTKKQRIADLERRVAELEARETWWLPAVASWFTCGLCGTSYNGIHSCWIAPPFTTTTVSDLSNIRLGGDNCAEKARIYSRGAAS